MDPVQVRTLILTALSAAIVGATLVDHKDAAAATAAAAVVDAAALDCGGGFQQHIEFNELITFNEFESCIFQEYQEQFQEIVEPIPEFPPIPIPELPDFPPGPPGDPPPPF
jgi:hypothetical protein